jgi:hypothetical protein
MLLWNKILKAFIESREREREKNNLNELLWSILHWNCGEWEHTSIRREKLREIADFYNLIKCKYNGSEAERREKVWESFGWVEREITMKGNKKAIAIAFIAVQDLFYR